VQSQYVQEQSAGTVQGHDIQAYEGKQEYQKVRYACY